MNWLKLPLSGISTEIYRYPSFYGMKHLGTGIPVVRGEHILEDGTLSTQWSNYWFIAPDVDAQYPRTKLLEGDLLCSVRGTIGKIGLVESNHVGANVSPNLIKISLNTKLVNCRYLWYFLRSLLGQQAIKQITSSTTISTIQASSLKQVSIPLPPMSEQRRIVEILDQADALRKKRAEADAKAERILPILFIKLFGDPATNPMGWEEKTLSETETDFRYGTSAKCDSEIKGLPVLRIPNILQGEIDSSELKYAELPPQEIDRLLLQEGDLLFVRTNGNPSYVGRSAVFDLQEPYLFASYLIRARLNLDKADPWFVAACLRTPSGRQVMSPFIRTTAGQSNISVEGLKQISIPLPPIEKQREFRNKIEDFYKMRRAREKARDLLETTFQSFLNRAFSGNLTAKWREVHMKELLAEMEQQAKIIGVSTDVEYEQLSLL